MAQSGSAAKSERFEARLTEDQKALFERAAAATGRSMTDFVLSSAAETARRVLVEWQTLQLSAEDSRRFAEAVLAAPAPNEHLLAAAERLSS